MIAVYPGTFDPITLGHCDIIERSSKIFGHILVAVAVSSGKDTAFSSDERRDMIASVIKEYGFNASVAVFDGLLVNFMKEANIRIIIRGLRAISDFEYEFQMSCMNSHLDSSIDTVFLSANGSMHFISSNIIRSVSELGGDVSEFVPKCILHKIESCYKKI